MCDKKVEVSFLDLAPNVCILRSILFQLYFNLSHGASRTTIVLVSVDKLTHNAINIKARGNEIFITNLKAILCSDDDCFAWLETVTV